MDTVDFETVIITAKSPNGKSVTLTDDDLPNMAFKELEVINYDYDEKRNIVAVWFSSNRTGKGLVFSGFLTAKVTPSMVVTAALFKNKVLPDVVNQKAVFMILFPV